MCLSAAALLAAGVVSLSMSGPDGGRAPAPAVRHLEYVFPDGEMDVYDIDQGNRLVERRMLPGVTGVRGVVASPARHRLYIAYHTPGSPTDTGSILAYDLLSNRIVWQRDYTNAFGPRATLDSMAITPDGRTIYMPLGETSGSHEWALIDPANGRVTGAIQAGLDPHDTAMGLNGKYVYLGAVSTPYLYVASTKTNRIVKKIGPLHGPGVRPFTINGSQTLAFTTARSYLGFQVSSITTGKVIYNVSPPGFTFDPATFGRTPNHGISLSPDERELYLVDSVHGYVHVFDVSGLPRVAPRDVADIKLDHPPPPDSWLQHSRDGRYVYVGSSGDVIDTRTRKIVDYLPALQRTAEFLEIDWRAGRPVSSTSRVGMGYATKRS